MICNAILLLMLLLTTAFYRLLSSSALKEAWLRCVCVFDSSIFGHKVNTCVPGTKPINGMYPACKFALTALTECLRQEVSYIEMGVRVTVRISHFHRFYMLNPIFSSFKLANLSVYSLIDRKIKMTTFSIIDCPHFFSRWN